MSDDEEGYRTPEEQTWLREKNIGAGGFGVVDLYRHPVTEEQVVLKQCRMLVLNDEDYRRWVDEMRILKSLNHINIVKARDLPQGFSQPPVPFIFMEYCDGGDLRKVLREPENCCGLPESDIRHICRDVTSGISFLHSEKVVHRDLKPENILIKRHNDRVVYKLTDFGYAKSYDQNSVCNSLVGTIQYVAPEVLNSTEYRSSVDFWSFGVVVYELITGKRPFLHGESANHIRWVSAVRSKSAEHISVSVNPHNDELVYSSSLPEPNQLCRPFKEGVTLWLQGALEYKPDRRGKKWSDGGGSWCLAAMEKLLEMKVLCGVCMWSGERTFMELSPDMRQRRDPLCQELGARFSSSSELVFVSTDGEIVDDNVLHNTTHLPNTVMMYLYCFSDSQGPFYKTLNPQVYPLLHNLLRSSSYSESNRREMFAHMLFHVKEQWKGFVAILDGQDAILKAIKPLCNSVGAESDELQRSHLEVKILTNFVNQTHMEEYQRLEQFHENREVPSLVQVAAKTLESWKDSLTKLDKTMQELKGILKTRDDARTTVSRFDGLSMCRHDNQSLIEEYKNTCVAEVKEKYIQAKKRMDGDYGREQHAQALLTNCVKESQRVADQLNKQNFGGLYFDLRRAYREVRACKDRLVGVRGEVEAMNKTRTETMWQLLIHERRSTPFHIHERRSRETSNREDSSHITDSFGAGAQYLTQVSKRSSVSSSIGSEYSYSDKSHDGAVEESLKKLQSIPDENHEVVERNQHLLSQVKRSMSLQ